MKTLLLSALAIAFATGAHGWAQVPVTNTAPDRLTFDVASIKENRSERFETFAYFYPASGRLLLINHPLKMMIYMAYGVRDFQLEGGLGWIGNTHYDIEAKASASATRQDLLLMLRSLLEDEFKVVLRPDTREGSLFVLVQANPGRLGPNITTASPEDARGRMNPVGRKGQGTQGIAATMSDLADVLSIATGRLVVDRTGLTGIYNFTIQSSGFGVDRTGLPPGVPPDALPPRRTDLPALTTALQEQLGLRLESQRGPIPILVIERAEQPTPHGYSTSAAPVQGEQPQQ